MKVVLVVVQGPPIGSRSEIVEWLHPTRGKSRSMIRGAVSAASMRLRLWTAKGIQPCNKVHPKATLKKCECAIEQCTGVCAETMALPCAFACNACASDQRFAQNGRDQLQLNDEGAGGPVTAHAGGDQAAAELSGSKALTIGWS